MNKVIKGEIKKQDFYKIGLVTSRFNSLITDRLELEAIKRLKILGFEDKQIIRVSVPGAFEIPLATKQLLLVDCDAVCALGAVIRGETSHYDYVCSAVERGCSELQLEFLKPVGFGVLTTENKEQALARSGGEKENKGAEIIDVVLEMLSLKSKII